MEQIEKAILKDVLLDEVGPKPQKPNENQDKKPDEHKQKPSGEKKDEKKDKRDE